MSFRNNLYELSLATEEDGGAINQVFDSKAFDGNICVQFSRKPNPYISLQNDGEKAVVCLLKIKATGEVIGVGACVIRKAFLNGQIKNVGYLTGMKILPEYHKKVYCIPECYEFLHQNTKTQVDLYYTTILKENTAAQKLLEKKHRNMPEYIYQGEYTVFCMKTGSSAKGMRVERGLTKELNDFYLRHLEKHNLAPESVDLYGLKSNDFFAYYDKNGRIAAACAVCNQQHYKQYTITAYNGIYKLIRKLPTKLLGYPAFPKINISANYACIALLFTDDNSVVQKFIKKVLSLSAEYDFMMLGLYEKNPLIDICAGIKHVKYQSRLYVVDFDGRIPFDDTLISLDVGLL